MNWVTLIWTTTISACAVMAAFHALIWLAMPRQYGRLAFVISAIGAALLAFCEYRLLLTETIPEAETLMRVGTVAAALMTLGTAWFVRLHLNAGRTWLVWGTTLFRIASIIANTFSPSGLQFSSITELRSVPFLGTRVSVPVGEINPAVALGQVANMLLLLLVLDAALTLWRRGLRLRASIFGTGLTLFVAFGSGHILAVLFGQSELPIMISVAYTSMILVMWYEASQDVIAAAGVARQLAASESSLLEGKRRMDLALQSTGAGTWDWDLQADHIHASPAAHSLYWLDGQNPLPFDRFEARVHPDDRGMVHDAIARAMQPNGHYDCEYRIQGPDAQERWIAANAMVERDAKGKPVRMLGVSRDITRQRNAEIEATQRRNELAHLSRVNMLGELSGSLAHELNQPLAAILSNAQAAQRFFKLEPLDRGEIGEILNDIASEAKRAGETINRLRILLRREQVPPQRLDINHIVQDVIRLLRSDLLHHGVIAHIELADDLPQPLADSVQVQQVLINLIVNACEAMHSTPAAERRLRFQTSADGASKVVVSITDNGCGIPDEHLNTVFEPFMTTKPNGIGLGLAVCRMVMHAQGGQLRVRNNATGGATFECVLNAPAAD